jgi:hypothetical protein
LPNPSPILETSTPRWFRLDNAAKLYPAISTGARASFFRLSAILKEPVDPSTLQTALDVVLPRFPAFAVRIHRGLFWYYFAHNPNRLEVQPDVTNPCVRMHWHENKGFLFRVFHYDRRISVEFFHALGDGSGALVFLKTLLAEYLVQKASGTTPLSPEDVYRDGVLDPREVPHPEEYEDAFTRYASDRPTTGRREPSAYHVSSTAEPVHTLDILTGVLPVDRLLEVSRGLQVSITEYLTAVYMEVLCDLQREELARRGQRPRSGRALPVRIQVPLNLRKFFPTRTVRNFSYFINIGVDAAQGDYTFQEILRIVHHTMRLGLDPRGLAAQFGQNVRPERNLLLRVAPLFIKNFAIAEIFRRVGEPTSSGTLTNLGAVELPPVLASAVDRFEMALGPSFLNRTSAAAVSFGGQLAVTFSRTCKETVIERGFFTKLVRDGIPVRIESNR